MYKNTKIFLYQKTILIFINFKGVSVSLASHPHYVMNGFHTLLYERLKAYPETCLKKEFLDF